MSIWNDIEIWIKEKTGFDDVILAADFNQLNENLKKTYKNTEYLRDFINNSLNISGNVKNLVYNYNFRYFSNQNQTINSWEDYNHPDGWIYEDDGYNIYEDENIPSYKKLFYLNNKYYIVGDNGLMATSHDLTEWTTIPAPIALQTATINEIDFNPTYNNNQGVYVLATSVGLYRTHDFVTFTAINAINHTCVCWGTGLGFAAANVNGTITTSTDGVAAWTANIVSNITSINAIIFHSVLKRYIAVGDNGGIAWSDNRTTWTNISTALSGLIDSRNFRNIIIKKDEFIALGDAGLLINSQDGINWDDISDGVLNYIDLNNICYSRNGLIVAVVGDAGQMAFSRDRKNWEFILNTNFYSYNIKNIIYADDKFIAISDSGKMTHTCFGGKIGYDEENKCCKIQTSTDGVGTKIFKQALHEFIGWKETLRGSTVTVKLVIKGVGVAQLTDGVSVVSCSFDSENEIEIELQIPIDEEATMLVVSIETEMNDNTIEIYKVYGNKGLEAVESLSCIVDGIIGRLNEYDATETPPAGELELNGIELPEGYSRLDSFINGKFGRGDSGRSKLDDMRGKFKRSWAHGSENDLDRDGRTDRGDGIVGDRVGTGQSDAIRNIIANITQISASNDRRYAQYGFGLFEFTAHSNNVAWTSSSNSKLDLGLLGFDSSKVVPTGSDNRPANKNVLDTISWC